MEVRFGDDAYLTEFAQVPAGSVFLLDGELYIKTQILDIDNVPRATLAVDLARGSASILSPDDKVRFCPRAYVSANLT